MGKVGIFRKIRKFIRYHFGPKEVTYDSELIDYMPPNMLDIHYILHIIKYDAHCDKYTVWLNYYKQEKDV